MFVLQLLWAVISDRESAVSVCFENINENSRMLLQYVCTILNLVFIKSNSRNIV